MDTEDMNSTETIPHVFVCRHGERIDFVERDWWKTSERPFDPHLSPHGYEQAQHLAERLSNDRDTATIKHILCSPYIRCVETIYPYAHKYNIPIKIEHGLHEWFGKATLQDLHMPLSTEELKTKFPLVDDNYQSYFQINPAVANEQDVHRRLFNVAKYVANSFYNPKSYEGDVILVTHAAAVIAAVRGFLTLKKYPEEFETDWYAKGGPGRVPVYSGVTGVHKLASNNCFLNWDHVFSENESHLPDPQQNHNWAYRPDRPRL